jgi:hypothetical protein
MGDFGPTISLGGGMPLGGPEIPFGAGPMMPAMPDLGGMGVGFEAPVGMMGGPTMGVPSFGLPDFATPGFDQPNFGGVLNMDAAPRPACR